MHVAQHVVFAKARVRRPEGEEPLAGHAQAGAGDAYRREDATQPREGDGVERLAHVIQRVLLADLRRLAMHVDIQQQLVIRRGAFQHRQHELPRAAEIVVVAPDGGQEEPRTVVHVPGGHHGQATHRRHAHVFQFADAIVAPGQTFEDQAPHGPVGRDVVIGQQRHERLRTSDQRIHVLPGLCGSDASGEAPDVLFGIGVYLLPDGVEERLVEVLITQLSRQVRDRRIAFVADAGQPHEQIALRLVHAG